MFSETRRSNKERTFIPKIYHFYLYNCLDLIYEEKNEWDYSKVNKQLTALEDLGSLNGIISKGKPLVG